MLLELMPSAAHLPTLPLRILTKGRPLSRYTPWYLELNPSWGSCHALGRAVHSSPERRAVYSTSKSTSTSTSRSKIKTKIIRDVLSPTPSHLLTVLLSDMLRGGHDHAKYLTASDTQHHSPTTHPVPNTDTDTDTGTGTQPYDSSPPGSLFTAPHALPPGHSLVYFPLQTPASKLAPDGADADHVPDVRFGRRLWAGGELRFRRGRAGARSPVTPSHDTPSPDTPSPGASEGSLDIMLDCSPWTCREDVRGAKRSGESYMVRLERLYARGLPDEAGMHAAWDIRETRTLVFKRGEGGMVAPSLTPTPHAGSYTAHFTPTPTHLFHFSALTYNAHGIHFDPLAARHDGHPALLVHGPLTLALMLRVLGDYLLTLPTPNNTAYTNTADTITADTNTADTNTADHNSKRRIVNFAYRNYAPLYVAQRAAVRVRRIQRPEYQEKEDATLHQDELYEVWIENAEGAVAASGTAIVEPE